MRHTRIMRHTHAHTRTHIRIRIREHGTALLRGRRTDGRSGQGLVRSPVRGRPAVSARSPHRTAGTQT
ncbi:hypothetical protein ABR737_15690 [Streptomyces sp. Edi2]|uniref:hypothetical protein n=1 Tax=Streptomyces sp. Edi2 TaxID=3162528 RepID=UPI0033061AE7